jgi:tetratricopeptide (TPR) repeat protein
MCTATAHAANPDKDPQLGQRVADAEKLVKARQPQAAIAKCDSVINAFNAEYGTRKERVYCATSSAESLGYLLETAVKGNDNKADKRNAIVLSSIWSNAYFLKGYALQDLGRIGDAKAALAKALHLSPSNPHYLCEMGTIYQREKDWNKALKTFKDAEDQNSLAPEETRADDLGRARRGTAYVLVELGKFDEAEKKYRQCLKTDPHDARAARELEYVQQQKQKRGSH